MAEDLLLALPKNDARRVSDERSAGEGAVTISVDDRLVPKYPHPVGVEDGVDAVLCGMGAHKRYGLDSMRIIFSAKANLVIS